MKSPTLNLILALSLTLSVAPLMTGCAGLRKSHQDNVSGKAPETAPQAQASPTPKPDWQVASDALDSKIKTMDARLAALNEKIDAQRSVIDNFISSQEAHQGVHPRVQDSAGIPIGVPVASSDPAAGFTSGEAVQRYRKAMILYQSKNYTDAILGFSAFVDRFPDHALAGSAQYFLAESYFAEHELKLAAREYQRVLTTYDRSPHISDTLERIAECEEALGQNAEAAQHREMLMTLFPASPAAARSKMTAARAPRAPVAQQNSAAHLDTSPSPEESIDEIPATAPARPPTTVPTTVPATAPAQPSATAPAVSPDSGLDSAPSP
jgi:tol-pal system protein YbgF